MRKNILLFFILFCFGFIHAGAQRCATHELHKKKLETDARYRAYYETIGQRMEAWSKQHMQLRASSANLVIPVVVHIVYNTNEQNISDAQVHSQIEVLNRDYNALNPDTINVPAPWKSIIGNAHITFCLATVKPNGDYTTGIERRYTTKTYYQFEDTSLKFSSEGGLNAWDATKYLNLWVCNTPEGLLGYTEMPGTSSAQIDGCVILYKAFGSTGNSLIPQYNKGRTATHEIGHWLGLFHIWADDGGTCDGTDHIDDTPNQAKEDYGCPSYPKTDICSPSGPGIMFMNYMDYTDDACMYMFTAGQVAVMNNILLTVRSSLLNSSGCAAPSGLKEINAESFISLYPNPANSVVHLDVRLASVTINSVTAFDMLGKELMTTAVHKTGEQIIDLDVSALSPGLYTFILNTDEGNIAKRFVVAR